MSNLTFGKIQLTPEVVDDFRLQFGQDASAALAKDLIDTFRAGQFQTQVAEDNDFFNFDTLSDGTAGFYDQLDPQYTMPVMRNGVEVDVPISEMLPAERKVRFNQPDAISALLTNAEAGSLPGAFASEFFKTAPSVAAGVQAAKFAAARSFRRPTTSFGLFAVQATPPALAFLGGSLLLYEGADALEELALGPDKVILPGQKQAIETARTAGGSVAGIQFPFLLSRSTNRAARDFLANLAEDAPRPAATRFTAAIENLIESAGTTAKGTRTGAALTVFGETVAGAGATTGAYVAEGIAPAQTGPRLGAELLGGATFAASISRMLPRVYSGVVDTPTDDPDAGFFERLRQGKQAKLFRRIDELYTKYDGNYARMMDDLNNDETNAILAEVFPGVDFTAAQRLDDNTGIIMGLETAMAGENPDLAAARSRADRNAREFMSKFIYGLMEQGDEDSIRAAALFRKQMFDDAIRTRLTRAVDTRVSAVTRLTDQTPLEQTTPELADVRGQSGVSVLLAATIDNQIPLGRARERELWSEVGGFTVFDPQEVIDTGEAPQLIVAFDELLKDIHPSYRKRFLSENSELVNAVNTMKRNLGFDIREQILETEAVIDGINAAARGDEADVAAFTRMQIDGFINRQTAAGNLPPADTVEGLQARIAIYNDRIDKLERLDMFVGNDPLPGYDTAEAINRLRSERIDPTPDRLLQEQFFTYKVGSAEEKAQFKTYLEAKKKLLSLELERLNPDRLKPVTADELYKLRSEILADAANIGAAITTRQGTANEARRLGELAESILDDLNAVPEGANDAYDVARAYSFAFNDVFTRSLVGSARAKSMIGTRRIPPELLTQQLIRGNPDVTSFRIQQLQGVSEFAVAQGFEGAEKTFTTLNNVMEAAVRDAMSTKGMIFPPDSVKAGEVNPEALAKWKQANAATLEAFPNLAQDLDSALTAQRTFEHYTRRSKKAAQISDSQKYLGTLISNTSPTMAIDDALNFVPKKTGQRDPVQGLRRLFRMTSIKYPEDVRGGLSVAEIQKKISDGYLNATMQYAMMKAGGESPTTFDPVTFHKTLFEPLPGQGAGKQTLVSLMEQYGILDEQQIRRIRTVSNQMVRLAAADAAGKLNDPNLVKEAGPIFDFYVGMIGLAGGTKAYQALVGDASGTGSISAAAFGKSFVLDLFKDIPASKRMEAIQMVFTDPDLAATLIRAPQNEKQALEVNNKIANIFAKNGFSITGGMSPYVIREISEDEDVGTGREEPIPTPTGGVGPVSSVAPTAMPAPPPIPAQPVAQPTTTLASVAPPPPPPTGGGQVDRNRFAALFPEDADLIRGIGSLRT